MMKGESLHIILRFFLIFHAFTFFYNCLSAQEFSSSNLPIVLIDTDGQEIPDAYRITAWMGIIYNGEGNRNYLDDPPNEYNGRIAIELRGSSTLSFPKKQYALETQDSLGNNLNVPIFGMPEENDWILYGPYSDKSLVRNVLAYQLAREMGWYASRTRLCELAINGDYRGVYVFMEKIKRDNGRVDIAKLTQDDTSGVELTGGYILKVDKEAGEEIGGWFSQYPPYPGALYQIFYQYHYPKPDKILPRQSEYIRAYISDLEDEFFYHSFEQYSSYLNLPSFVDYFLLTELSRNVDGYRLSAFFYKDRDDRDSRLVMGPVWDFNLAFGNADYYDGYLRTGWQIDFNQPWDQFQIPFWWRVLWESNQFRNLCKTRWVNLRSTIFSEQYILHLIDSLEIEISEAVERNFQRWQILGVYVWPNYFVGNTWEEEVLYLKGWIMDRLEWIDENLPGEVLSVSENSGEFTETKIAVYPNPGNSRISISFNGLMENIERLTIYNLQGKVVFISNDLNFDNNAIYNIDISSFSSGIYFLEISDGASRKTRKFLVIK